MGEEQQQHDEEEEEEYAPTEHEDDRPKEVRMRTGFGPNCLGRFGQGGWPQFGREQACCTCIG